MLLNKLDIIITEESDPLHNQSNLLTMVRPTSGFTLKKHSYIVDWD